MNNITTIMIAVAYINLKSFDGLQINMFETKEEAKQWLIDELIDNKILTNWMDDDGKIYIRPDELKVALMKETLEDIIDGSIDGELHIKCYEH